MIASASSRAKAAPKTLNEHRDRAADRGDDAAIDNLQRADLRRIHDPLARYSKAKSRFDARNETGPPAARS